MARTRRYELDDEDAADENGILRDGARIRVGVQMLNSAGRPLVDGLGQPLAGGSRWSGYVFVDEHKGSQRAVDHELRKAQLSAAWRGGLRAGDQLTIGDQRLDVLGYNADDRLVLADASELDREAGLDADSIKQQAYDAAVAELVMRGARVRQSIRNLTTTSISIRTRTTRRTSAWTFATKPPPTPSGARPGSSRCVIFKTRGNAEEDCE